MKCKMPAAELKGVVKSVQALQALSGSSQDELFCCFTQQGEQTFVESSFMGTYLRRVVGATPLRPGRFGVSVKPLAKTKLTGDITVDYDADTKSVKVFGGKSKYEMPTDQTALAIVDGARPETSSIAMQVRVPAKLLAEATATSAIKPGLKEDDLQLEFDITTVNGVGQLSVTGLDNLSCASFVRRSQDIKVKQPIRFILKSSAVASVLSEAKTENITIGASIGANGQAKLVCFKSEEIELLYPTIIVPYIDAAEQSAEVRALPMDFSFTVLRKAFREALSTVRSVHDGSATMTFVLTTTPQRVVLSARTMGANADAIVEADNIKLGNEVPCSIYLNELYLTELLNLAPEVLPLEIAAWNKTMLTIKAMTLDNGTVEFLMSQSRPMEQQAEQKQKRKKKDGQED